LQVELVIIDTVPDRRLDIPIWQMGGKGAFVKEIQALVLDGRADLAVHSAKDLPSVTHDDLLLAAVPPRGEARDALVGSALGDLPPGARVGTGSVRRRAQLANARPDLTFGGLRGNMHTRLAKAAQFDAIVVAAVAFQRLGLDDHIAEVIPTTTLLPQVGQGALAVECRRADLTLAERLGAIEDRPSRRHVDAERAFLAELGGDCDLPAGAHAVDDAQGGLVLDALLASLDGRIMLRHAVAGTEPTALGAAAARHLLDKAGGRDVLDMT
jgi:hydroxymethylbilane synthase